MIDNTRLLDYLYSALEVLHVIHFIDSRLTYSFSYAATLFIIITDIRIPYPDSIVGYPIPNIKLSGSRLSSANDRVTENNIYSMSLDHNRLTK